MDIHIDLHLIANIVSVVLVMVFCVSWALFFRRLVTFLVMIGLGMTVMVADRSDLAVGHLEAIAIVGVILTALLVIGFVLLRASVRRSRLNRTHRPGRQPSPLPMAQPQRTQQPRTTTAPTRTGARRAAIHVPEPQYSTQELPEFADGDWDEEEDEDEVPVQVVRQPVRPVRQPGQQHSAQSRARYRVNRPEDYSRARGARLQGGR